MVDENLVNAINFLSIDKKYYIEKFILRARKQL